MSLNQLWDEGLSDVWRRNIVQDYAKKIVSLEDIENQVNRPWTSNDIQLYKVKS